MVQLEQLQYRSKRPLTRGLAREFARLETLRGVFLSGTGFTSSSVPRLTRPASSTLLRRH